jgi:hypothetical protein
MAEPPHSCCEHESLHGHPIRKKAWYRDPLLLTLLGIAGLFVLSFFFPFLQSFRHAFLGYVRIMAWPIGLGFLIGGLVDYYVPQEYISKYLARRSKRTVFYAVGLGFLASACSHGVITLSMELHKKGASGPAVVSFLLASPWASLPITFLLIGFFGWKAFLIILGALAVALVTGLTFQILDQKGWIERNKHSVEVTAGFSIRKDLVKRFRESRFTVGGLVQAVKGVLEGMWDLVEMVLWWILIGVILASFAAAFVPQTIFQRFFGPTLVGLLLTMILATVLEVCSEGTSPVAFEIYRQTGALGNAFAFLMGGVVTDYTEIGLVWMNLGKKTALWMVVLTIPQVLFLGWIYNALFG